MNVQNYFEYTKAPWGRLFYKLVLHNLPFENKNILDFGSGFGITASALAEKNSVTAVEPNEEMLFLRAKDDSYTQLHGRTEILKGMPDRFFDVIICHNVFEYISVADREDILNEFYRILKPDGILSVIKHNKYGKIMQKAVFEFDVNSTLALLDGKNIESFNFGQIKEYSLKELLTYCEGKFIMQDFYGVRTFYGLQNNGIKFNENWLSDMFKLECAAESVDELRNVAFFHHVILKKEQV